jgi:membrane protein DedA with SNARE-associated domain
MLLHDFSMHTVAVLIHEYGLLVIAGFIGLESIGVPLPGETALIVAGGIAGHTHELEIVPVILTAAGSAFVGRLIGYVVGARFGYWLLLRYGPYLRITERRIKLGQYLFLRHGSKIIVVAQFIPVLRFLAGILAGTNRMPVWSFVLATAIGVLAWAVVFGYAGYFLGREFARLAGPMMIVVGVAATIVVIVAIVFTGRHEAQLVAKAERALPGPLRLP